MNYHVVASLIADLHTLRLNRGAEVGVLDGDTSEYLLKRFPTLQLYSIDPYVDYSEHEHNRTRALMNKHEMHARNKLVPFGQRSVLIKDFSVPASQQFADNSLDFVFIDAIHTYEAVSEDLQAWVPKVRVGGLIMGHDISWEGVQRAVSEFGAANNLAVYRSPSTSDVWFCQKPDGAML
jgi:predicted O-methyltransferase YrrM